MIVPSIINCNLLSSQLAVKRSVIVSVYSWYLEVEIKPLLSRDLERKFEKKKEIGRHSECFELRDRPLRTEIG